MPYLEDVWFIKTYGAQSFCDCKMNLAFPSPPSSCPCVPGDQVSRKGTLTGGFYDARRSRLEIQSRIVELKAKLEATQGEKDQLRGQIDDILPSCVCVCLSLCQYVGYSVLS